MQFDVFPPKWLKNDHVRFSHSKVILLLFLSFGKYGLNLIITGFNINNMTGYEKLHFNTRFVMKISAEKKTLRNTNLGQKKKTPNKYETIFRASTYMLVKCT